MSTVKSFIAILAIVYILAGLYLYIKQRSLLYFPTKENTDKYKNILIQNDTERINIIVLNEGHKNAILYFGGNAESMALSSDYIAKQFPTFTVYLMDYRGYGKSTGEASEEALYGDALKLYDTIKPKHQHISIGGRSLGSGIATYIAVNREVARVALITPYDSIVSVAQGMYPLFPVSLLLNDKYNSAGRAKEITAKTMIVMAENDTLIPAKNTENLIDSFDKVQPEVVIIENRGHGDISSDERYYKIMQEFIGDGE